MHTVEQGVGSAASEDADYKKYRRQVLLASMVGYGLFYFCRKNISVALPLLSRDLGYSNEQLGALGSALYISYGISKFGSGLIADRRHPRYFLLAGLLLSICANLVFGLSSSLAVFTVVWTLNGVFQSTGAPACAKILATWFGAKERGTKTAIWNISHQGGGGLVLIIAGIFATYWGWRATFIGPAILSLVGALIVARYLYDRPESMGLPPIDVYLGEPLHRKSDSRFSQIVIKKVFLNPRVWLGALASCCTYIVRYGALDWSPKFLYEARHQSIGAASFNASLLELLGIPGALLCGIVSDRIFKTRRAPVVIVSLLALAASIYLLYLTPAGHPYLDTFLLACIGFFTYGPQLLLAGVNPVDMSDRDVAAAAVGFTGLMSYVGATVSSLGTGYLLDHQGWQGAFYFWIAAALLAALFCLPLWNKKAA